MAAVNGLMWRISKTHMLLLVRSTGVVHIVSHQLVGAGLFWGRAGPYVVHVEWLWLLLKESVFDGFANC